jgi:hypothetical protein
MASPAEMMLLTPDGKTISDDQKQWLRDQAAEGHWPSNGTRYVKDAANGDWESTIGWLVLFGQEGDRVKPKPDEEEASIYECHGCGVSRSVVPTRKTACVCLWDGQCMANFTPDEEEDAHTGAASRDVKHLIEPRPAKMAHCFAEFDLCFGCFQRAFLVMTASDHLVKGQSWGQMRRNLRKMLWCGPGTFWALGSKEKRMEEEIRLLHHTISQKDEQIRALEAEVHDDAW